MKRDKFQFNEIVIFLKFIKKWIRPDFDAIFHLNQNEKKHY